MIFRNLAAKNRLLYARLWMYVQILGILFTICENLNLNSDLILFLFPDRTDDERFVQKKKKQKKKLARSW